MAIVQVTQLSDGFIPANYLDTRYYTDVLNISVDQIASYLTTGTNVTLQNVTVFECSNTFKCTLDTFSGVLTFWYNNQQLTSGGNPGFYSKPFYIAMAYDDSTQTGYISLIGQGSPYDFSVRNSNLPTNPDTYLAIKGADVPPITYTWQSVPSISGKNGILTLSTLNDVNDGEPVETSDASKFNLTDDSNVSALVTARLSE